MANKSSEDNKYAKFRGFENWLQWANLTKLYLKRKKYEIQLTIKGQNL